MKVRTTGVEFKKFWKDETVWTDGAWVDEEHLLIDGKDIRAGDDCDYDNISECAVVEIRDGVILRDGDDEGISLVKEFTKWQKKQTMITLIVEVPKELVENVRVGIVNAGGRLIAEVRSS